MDVIFARQAIFDADHAVRAYELYFRRPGDDGAVFDSAARATSEVILNAFVDLDIEAVTQGLPVLVNIPPSLLIQGVGRLLPSERAILHINGRDPVDDGAVRAVASLAATGYRVAIGDAVRFPALRALEPYAHLAKVGAADAESVRSRVGALVRRGIRPLATRLETHEAFAVARDAGAELFQGYFLRRPRPVTGRAARGHGITLVRLLAELHAPDAEVSDLERVISSDIGLSYGLLRMVNSALYSLRREVSSIRHALTLLGIRRVRQWASLMVLAGVDDKPDELYNIALVRGRMCEQLARASGTADVQPFFIVGLFSLLDAILDRPLPELIDELPLAPEVAAAVLEGRGPAGAALSCVLAQEECRLDDVAFPGLDEWAIQDAYLEAITWAAEVQNQIAQTRPVVA